MFANVTKSPLRKPLSKVVDTTPGLACVIPDTIKSVPVVKVGVENDHDVCAVHDSLRIAYDG